MSDHLDVLERAASRGRTRGLDEVLEGARRRVQRQRRRRTATLVVGAALVAAGIVAVNDSDDSDSEVTIAARLDEEVVALVPGSERFEMLSFRGPERMFDGFVSPTDHSARIAIHQRLTDDGAVDAALVVSVMDSPQHQFALLHLYPLSEERVSGAYGTYAHGHDPVATDGLVVVERKVAGHVVRAAGRNLETPTVVAALESVRLGPDGTIEAIELPDRLPAAPIYEGIDAFFIGMSEALITQATYLDTETNRTFRVTTRADGPILPAEALAWLYDGRVLHRSTSTVVVGDGRHGHNRDVLWNHDATTSVVVSPVDPRQPFPVNLVEELVHDTQPVGESRWQDITTDVPQQQDTVTTEVTEP